MSTAHTCFRSALTQAFRTNSRGVAVSSSVAAFLVPTLARRPKRSFATGQCRSSHAQPSVDLTNPNSGDGNASPSPPNPHGHSTARQFVPPQKARGDVKAWLAAIESFLPSHLRQEPSSDAEIPINSLKLAHVLNKAQASSIDILSHLGLVEGRWQAVVWMVKKLTEDEQHSINAAVQSEQYANVMWRGKENRSMKDLTESPLFLQRNLPLRKPKLTLDATTSTPDSIRYENVKIKRALGQLWRSLGHMILAAAEQDNAGQDAIMQHVLQVIAYLHHKGFIPDSVYTYRPHEDKHALQQPPTIHMLSSQILTALSDATWKAHEASVKTAKERANAQYLFGHEIPGSRYKAHITEVAPELWLELVLWSCLHGGWVLDGAAILQQLADKQGEHSWALISWREIMEKERQSAPAPSRSWSLLPMNENASARAEDRARTRKTISGEVVTVFVDGLVNQMRLGVGYRGADPEQLVASIKRLKELLDANNLSLGSMAWDSIMARLVESGGFVPEKRPEMLLHIFQLAPGFGAEVGTANAPNATSTEIPYFFEPTTLPLSLLHRTMRAFIRNGDIDGAMKTLALLQRHTDDNKQKSVQQFFSFLKNRPQLRKDEPFTSRQPPVSFPAFDTKLPVSLLAQLLDLATECKLFDLGRWLLFSEDLDGPLISPALYGHRNISASIVRFGTLAGENDVVLKVVKKAAAWNEKHQQQRMPAEILIALLCCQMKLRRWEAVEGMQKYVEETATFRPRPIIISTFVAELLRTSSEAEESRVQAQEAFSGLLFAWERMLLQNMREELNSALCILSTVDDEWKQFCSRFLAFSWRQAISLSTDDFNRVLGGVLDGYGSVRGRATVEQWCYQGPKQFEPYRAPGGLARMAKYRVTKGEQYEDRPGDIELVQASGARVVLQGRIHANRQTIWAIVRKVQEEVVINQGGGEALAEAARTEVVDTVRWAARVLYCLGVDYDDIVGDLGSLAELAGLEGRAARERELEAEAAW
ncbi:uncharacterized protein SETTUDRAFT_140637 [Exserohilum turcica Et28A]|uniref:Uncharacterized protein n=1 Tax=Exserohilum turcicum (strain 28A) TaxID=671987 RepID=R0JMQ0_EXST2|nr:uncharacterized protein SETTUDRAFT_140637 [Exserohilum turcica Et28A]EOA82503.1 hypothetical protein SETTUDRAFT_140637 [Exserohilum turcica Et28A]